MAELAAIARPYAEAAFAVAVGDGGGDGGLSRHPRSPHHRHPRSPLSGGGAAGHGDGAGAGHGAGDGGARVDAWSAFLARAATVVDDAQVAQLLQNPRADKNRVLALIADIAIGDGDGHGDAGDGSGGHSDSGDGDAGDGGISRHTHSPSPTRHPRSQLSGGGHGDVDGDSGDGDGHGGGDGNADDGHGNSDTVTTQHNLLKLLAANGRLPVLPAIAARFEHLRAEAEGSVDAELVTALPVGDAQQRAIAESLSRKLGRQVRLSAREDSGLIGGAIVRAGDMVIDASVRGQLAQLAGALDA